MNRKLRVGVWIIDNYLPMVGGGFGYYSELINSISSKSFLNADISFLGYKEIPQAKIGLHKYTPVVWRMHSLGFFARAVKYIGTKVFSINRLTRYFRESEYSQRQSLYNELLSICDIIYYPLPMCQFEDFPFIYTLWDLGHLNGYAFPEVSAYGVFENRKEHHDRIPLKALMVFCESETGKTEAVKYLNINEKRIKVLPLIPSGVISEKINPVRPDRIQEDWCYIHYPAQFWAHKNHYNLIAAFASILRYYPDLKLVLSGSDHGNMQYIDKIINQEKLMGQVINLGFISYEELKWLYLHSKGLIMPTLLGPTNMPPLEAIALGCPVAVSDLPGHREQLGEAAIYFNPLKTEEIEFAIERLIKTNSEENRKSLPTADSIMVLLEDYFAEIKTIRNTWW